MVFFVICSVNGIPACLNKKLMTDIVRKEYGFTGFIISDDLALEFAVEEHKYVPTYEQAAADAVLAGCNLELTDTERDFTFRVRVGFDRTIRHLHVHWLVDLMLKPNRNSRMI